MANSRQRTVPNEVANPANSGSFYLIQVVPDVYPGRLKFGWSSNVVRRFRLYRAVAPSLKVLRVQSCSVIYENALIHYFAEGLRPVGGEVFDSDDVDALLARFDAYFAIADERGKAPELHEYWLAHRGYHWHWRSKENRGRIAERQTDEAMLIAGFR